MTSETAIKQLRVMVSKQADALDRVQTHSGIPWRLTPLGMAATKLLAETDPDGGADQQSLDESPFPAPETVSYPLDADEQAHVDRMVAEAEAPLAQARHDDEGLF